MIDYTPTTEEVEERYCCDPYAFEFGCDHKRSPDFYRWLAEVKAEAWEEGYAQGDADARTENRLDSENPYTKEFK